MHAAIPSLSFAIPFPCSYFSVHRLKHILSISNTENKIPEIVVGQIIKKSPVVLNLQKCEYASQYQVFSILNTSINYTY